jgi:hypothetical protein
MPALLPPPVLQFCDANGAPYAGGTIATYVPGTTTPVTTWSEITGSVANTNPIVLDAAGRCTIYASGVVRLILSDALGNLIWDQPSSTLVSAAMAPVVIAPDIPTAVALLGIPGLISAETTLRTAAVSAETTRAEAAESAETTRAEAAEATLTAAVAAETTRAEAAEAALGGSIASSGPSTITKAGFANASSGHGHVTFATPFPHSLLACVASVNGSGYVSITVNVTADVNGCDVYISQGGYTLPAVANFYWIAVGN